MLNIFMIHVTNKVWRHHPHLSCRTPHVQGTNIYPIHTRFWAAQFRGDKHAIFRAHGFSLEIEHVHVTTGHNSWCSKEQSLRIDFPKHFKKHQTHDTPPPFRFKHLPVFSSQLGVPNMVTRSFRERMLNKNQLEFNGISLFSHGFPPCSIWFSGFSAAVPRSWPISSSIRVLWWILEALRCAACGWNSWRNCCEATESISRRGNLHGGFRERYAWTCCF